jgi:hypothetical protein
MSSNHKNICNEFNTDIWLYLDKDLPDKRILFWDNHLNNCDSCKMLLNESEKLVEVYNDIPLDDLSDNIFNNFISKTTENELKPKKLTQKISRKNRNSLVELFGFYRLIFGGAAISAAIILLLVMFLKNPDIEIKNVVQRGILDWEGTNIINKIEKVEDKLLSLQTDEWDVYIVRRGQKQKWKTKLKNIRKQLVKLKSERDLKEL